MHSASSLSLFLIINLSFEIFPTAFKVQSCSPPPIRTNFDRKFNNHPHVKVKFQFFEFAIKWQIFFEYFCTKILYRWNLFKSRNIEFWIERIKFDKTLVSKTKMTRVDPPVPRPYSWKDTYQDYVIVYFREEWLRARVWTWFKPSRISSLLVMKAW